MSDPVKVCCGECGVEIELQDVRLGSGAVCSKCGGGLVAPAGSVVGCANCGEKFNADEAITLARTMACPDCRGELRLIGTTGGARCDSPGASLEVTVLSGNSTASVGADARLGSTERTLTTDASAVDLGKYVDTVRGTISDASSVSGAKSSGGIRQAKFGKYTVESEIARGGCGIVYKAYDPDLRRHVALKVLIAGETASDQDLKRFLLEARAAAQLKHPNIVPVHEFGEIDGQHYFTMDYVSGADMSIVVRDPERDLDEYVSRLAEVCDALALAHARGIIHRDIKPQNIMIDESGRPLLMDFGLAKDFSSNTIQSLSGVLLGTPLYMSPEQARGQTRETDRRTDIYSMGVILYELATGKKPFDGENLFEVIAAVVGHDPVLPRRHDRRISADLETIILKCIEKKPSDRYAGIDELADDLRRYLAGDEITARPVGAVVRGWRRFRRSRAATAVFAGVPIALVATGIAYRVFAGGRLLENIEESVDSRNPVRMASALTMLDSGLRENKFSGKDEIARAEKIVAAVIGGPSEQAEATALTIVSRGNDVRALPLVAGVVTNGRFDDLRRRRAILCISAMAARIDEQDKYVATLASVAGDTGASAALRTAALDGLSGFSTDEKRERVIAAALDSDAPRELRLAAIRELKRTAAPISREMQTLLRLQGDEDPAIVAAIDDARDIAAVSKTYNIPFVGRAGEAVVNIGKAVGKTNIKASSKIVDALDPERGKAREKKIDPVEAVRGGLSSGNTDERTVAVFDLGVIGDGRALPVLYAALDDADDAIRRAAARSILKISRHAEIDYAAVARNLKSADPSVRDNAARLLGWLEHRASAPLLIETLAGEDSPRTARALARSLADMLDPDALPAMRAAYERFKADQPTALALIAALAVFGRRAASDLRTISEESLSRRVREAAASALAEIADEPAEPERVDRRTSAPLPEIRRGPSETDPTKDPEPKPAMKAPFVIAGIDIARDTNDADKIVLRLRLDNVATQRLASGFKVTVTMRFVFLVDGRTVAVVPRDGETALTRETGREIETLALKIPLVIPEALRPSGGTLSVEVRNAATGERAAQTVDFR